jgi:hypothetical protein
MTLALTPGRDVLLFDLAEFEALRGARQAVLSARKHPLNPVLGPGDNNEWDSAQASPWPVRTVLYDEQERLFKMWYGGCDAAPERNWKMGYAVSADGVHWEKPVLGLFEHNGRRDNNIIHPVPYGAVIKDLSEPDPARRYKMHLRQFVRYSADGIHWPADPPAPGTAPVEFQWGGPRAWDVVAFLRDEQDPDPARRYKFVFQYYDKAGKPGPDLVRFKGLCCGPDELRLAPAPGNPLLCPNDGFEHENHFLAYVPYKGQYLLLYECGWYQPDGTGKFGRYLADIRLAHSRDGERFTRILPGQPLIPRGAPGEWDEQFLVISDNAVIKDGRVHLYYCGQGNDWASWPPGNASPGLAVGPGCTSVSRTGLATLPMDHFTCIETVDGASFGDATTHPFEWTGAAPARLAVNVSATRPRRDWLQVEVLDAAGAPLPGYGRSDCRPLCADALAAPVLWTGGPALPRGPARLRFHLFGAARLHSFVLS